MCVSERVLALRLPCLPGPSAGLGKFTCSHSAPQQAWKATRELKRISSRPSLASEPTFVTTNSNSNSNSTRATQGSLETKLLSYSVLTLPLIYLPDYLRTTHALSLHHPRPSPFFSSSSSSNRLCSNVPLNYAVSLHHYKL